MGQIDLHVHTCYSADGEYEPEKIVELAKDKGLESIAITDHDTVGGLPEAIKAAKHQGIEVIPGIELDTQYKEKNLHILGYYLEWKSNKLADVTTKIRDNQYKQAKARVELLQKMGFELSWANVKQEANILPVGGIIAKVLLNNGLNDDDLRLKPYFKGERSEQPYFNFYLDYFLPGKPAYVSADMPDTRDMISLIHELGGVAVLAHPGSAIDLNELEYLLEELVESGLDGIEAYSNYHSEVENEEFADWATEQQLLITAGSDFHGRLKPDIKLGDVANNRYHLVKKLKQRADQI